MKHIDEYRDPALVQGLCNGIRRRAARLGRQVSIMEVCGSHTHAIGRFGIRGLLPGNVRLISGPGCPVCVTAVNDVDTALCLSEMPGTILATFGDMLRVPGTGGACLQDTRARGAQLRVIGSARDCATLARQHPDQQVVFLAIGFETTAPTVAALIDTCVQQDIDNLSVFCTHKTLPPALQVLIDDPDLAIDGFLCPGHVSTIIGADAYLPVVRAGRAAVITGFEPVDILEGLFLLLGQLLRGEPAIEIQYTRGVKPGGNERARAAMARIFRPVDATWRGLGLIPGSGLALQETCSRFDALQRFQLPERTSVEPPGCRCGDILRGRILPPQCALFGARCTPATPIGPCMVSSEGTCAAYYKYSPVKETFDS